MQTKRDLTKTVVLTVMLIGLAVAPAFAQTDDYGSGTTSSTYCPQLFQTVVRGSSGNQVLELQKFLSDYYDILPATIQTGYFGRITQRYVIQFQKEQGLPSYGIAGSMTRAAIARACGQAVTSSPTLVKPTGGANFSASPMSGSAPLSVTFTAEGLAHQWSNPNNPGVVAAVADQGSRYIDFGDGSTRHEVVCENAAGPTCTVRATHTYQSSGTYTASLVDYGGYCAAPCPHMPISTVTIIVSGNTNTQSVDFRLSSLSSSNFAIFGAPLANGDSATNYEIEFGDGEKATMVPSGSSCPGSISTNCSPSPITSMYNAHQYVKQGTFIARLKNLTMSCTSQDCNVVGRVTVTIGSPKPPPSSSVY